MAIQKSITREWTLKVNITCYTQEKHINFAARKIALHRGCMEMKKNFGEITSKILKGDLQHHYTL